MQVIGNKNKDRLQARLTIRVSKQNLSFSVVDREAERQLIYDPYTVNTGISMAANLRQAFKEDELLQRGYTKARVLLDAPTLLIPIEQFCEEDMQLMFQHAFMGHDNDAILYRVQPALNTVAVFPINKDLKLVVEDNFPDIRFTPIMQPVCNYLYQHHFVGIHHKLYGYFHDQQLMVFSFDNNRFSFFNAYDGTHAKDCIYFLLYVWKQLGYDQQKDELHLLGNIPDGEWLVRNLRIYLSKVLTINPSAAFNRSPITEIEGIPFDLLAHYLSK